MKNCKPAEERTGRWTKTENLQFIEGLKEYGKDWLLISLSMGTRTSNQVRSHAQKYFIRQASKLMSPTAAPKHEIKLTPRSSKFDASTQYGEGMLFPSF